MYSKKYTFFVSKFDKSIDVNDEQLKNISIIDITVEVLKLDKLIDLSE